MPKVIIIAGPNGAGKTSFARELEDYPYLEDEDITAALEYAIR